MIIVLIIEFGSGLWLIAYESIQMYRLKGEYWRGFWNYNDLGGITLGTLYLILAVSPVSDSSTRPIAAIAALL